MKPFLGAIILLAIAGCSDDSLIICMDEANCNTDTGGTNNTGTGGPVSDLSIRHRSGQTFLVWNESSATANYHVYRSDQPITSDNLSSATRLTDRWGPLDQDTSVNKYGSEDVPGFFVVEDLNTPLNADTGLFVHTTQTAQAGNAYYAVTTVENNDENITIVAGANATTNAVQESVATPTPVLTTSVNDGKARIYTQYMDYANWNPTHNGYAFNYTVALPSNYNPAQSYPLQVHLHAYGDKAVVVTQSQYDWETIQLFPNDPGGRQNTLHTWWYGHAADHNYLTQGTIPSTGRIENFTEQRVISAINAVVSDASFNVNTDLIHAYGNSMGASGSVSLAMRYPSVFSGIYASEPMTNYASSPGFQSTLVQIWGEQSSNLPITNGGPDAGDIKAYDGTGVWTWMNHQQQLNDRPGDNFAFMMMDFGKADTVIDWQTQGKPMIQALNNSKTGFIATALGGIGHDWLGFNAVNQYMFGTSGNFEPWSYPNSLSFVGLQFASGSGPLPPGDTGDDEYNTSIEWSSPHYSFHQNIVDSQNRYEISLRSLTFDQTVSVTPRNTQAFKPSSGTQCSWTANRNSDNTQVASGTAAVDNNDLVTAASVPVSTGIGTRLMITCP